MSRFTISLLLFFKNMNPNGNPLLENEPRYEVYDRQTFGFQTDVCLKRLIRDSMASLYPNDPLYHDKKTRIAEQNKLASAKDADGKPIQVGGKDAEGKKVLADNILKRFRDVRLFGLCGVDGKEDREDGEDKDNTESGKKGTKVKKEKASYIPEVRTGPVRVSYSMSIHPVVLEKDQIARTTHSTEAGVSTFGKYDRIRAGLYHATILYAPNLAQSTGCTADDVEKMLAAVAKMGSTIHSRGRRPHVAGLYVFKHADQLGNTPDEVLTDLVIKNIRHINKFVDVRDFSEFEMPETPFLKWGIQQLGISGVEVEDYLLKYGTQKPGSGKKFPSIEDWKKEHGNESHEIEGPVIQAAAR